MENKKFLVQGSWLTELPTMEKPQDFENYPNEWKANWNRRYLSHLAFLPKICRCEGLKDGAIVEEKVDFRRKYNDAYCSNCVNHVCKNPEHILAISTPAASTPAPGESIELWNNIVCDINYSDPMGRKEFIESLDRKYFIGERPAPGDKGGEEAAGNGFLESLRSSIQHFKKEGKGEFAAGILLAVNRYKEYAALWQAASQEKGVGWVKASERLPDLKDYSESELHFKFDGKKPRGVQFLVDGFEIHEGTTYTGYDLTQYHRLEWLDESPRLQEAAEKERDELVRSAEIFAVAFACWVISPEGEMYRASGISAHELLEKYKNRPFISTDTTKQ